MNSAPATTVPRRGERMWPLEMPWVTIPLALFAATLTWRLWPEWSSNPDLSHGFFAPLIFVLLLTEGRRNGSQRWLESGPLLSGAILGLAIIAILLFGAAGLFAASLQWTHSLVYFVLAASLAAGLFAGALCLADSQVRLLPLNWPVIAAIGMWLLVVPLPPGTYEKLTMGLQEMVTSGVLASLHILAIPAQRSGNIIELAHTTVGVEEACSGIRSLLSCIYAGFLFSAWLVQRTGPRVLMLAIAPVLAVAMNFVRSLGLTLMANSGTDISGFWHDATGFAILGVTAIVLATLASCLSGRPSTEREGAAEKSDPSAAPPAGARRPIAVRSFGGLVVGGGALVVAALMGVFALFRPAEHVASDEALDVMTLLPSHADGWRAATARNLYQFSDVLRTTHLGERTYLREIDGELVQLTVYVAHWPAGQAPVSLVASHTPDACWPGTGWIPQPDRFANARLSIDGQQLPMAEQRYFVSDDYPQYVWFWHIYDGSVISYRDPHSISALLHLALEYGFRRQGSQYFIRISSNQPWEKLAATSLLHQILSNFAPLGLVAE